VGQGGAKLWYVPHFTKEQLEQPPIISMQLAYLLFLTMVILRAFGLGGESYPLGLTNAPHEISSKQTKNILDKINDLIELLL
jgi:hypothetical protein